MFDSKISSKTRITILVFLLCALCGELVAQDYFQFNGPYQLGPYQGDASYDFIIKGQDSVKNGKFSFQQFNASLLVSGQDHYFSANGNFAAGEPTALWQFEVGTFQPMSTQSFQNFQYKINVLGTHTQANGKIEKGKPQGDWMIGTYRVRDSEITDTLFLSKLNFELGVPQQDFQIQFNDMTLVGRFLRDGLAHDQWELFSAENLSASESWQFSEGRLSTITTFKNDSSYQEKIYTEEAEQQKTIPLDQRFLAIIKLKRRLNAHGQNTYPNEISSILAQNVKQYAWLDSLYTELGLSNFMPLLKVSVNHYPLSERERTQLDALKSLHRIAQSSAKDLLKDTQLHLLTFTDEEVSFGISALKHLALYYLPFIEEFLSFEQQGVLDYVPHDALLSGLWENEFPISPNSIPLQKGDSIITKHIIKTDELDDLSNQEGIEAMLTLTRQVSKSIEFLKEKLEKKLKAKERREELMELENMLISASTDLNNAIDSLGSTDNLSTLQLLDSIKAQAKQSLADYSAMVDFTSKKQKVVDLAACFLDMKKLAYKVTTLHEKQEEIQLLYEDEIWNPFTATLMTEQVKRRITDAYKETLIPYIRRAVMADLQCEESEQLNKLIDTLHLRMKELREEETDKLERKLKKERDPVKIFRLLGIDMNAKVVEK